MTPPPTTAQGTLLQTMPDHDPGTVLLRTRDRAAIVRALRPHGVTLRSWPLLGAVTADSDPAELLLRYRERIADLCAAEGLPLVDVARVHSEDANPGAGLRARAAFRREHRHSEDEVRFFAHGTGCFYLHLDGLVLALVCVAGDLLSIPAGTRHWFDMGARPDFAAIRFFEREDGWVGDFTGDPVSARMPSLDQLLHTSPPPPTPVLAVVLDIEGTTGALSHVHEVLLPYARPRIRGWLTANQHSPQGEAVLAATRSHGGTRALTLDGAIRVLEAWADQDVKAPPLKTLQALIWAGGYRSGELSGPVYPDVPPALARWQAEGVPRYVYSAGAVPAQRDWFAHTAFGDLTPLLDGYFDLASAGPKGEPDSYRTIAAAIGVPPAAVLFLSDAGAELDAAAAAGWQVVAVRRAEDPRGPEVPGRPTVATLAELRPPNGRDLGHATPVRPAAAPRLLQS